jgi:hypothetical protein
LADLVSELPEQLTSVASISAINKQLTKDRRDIANSVGT